MSKKVEYSVDKSFTKRIQKVSKYFGTDSRLFRLMEECAELIQASSKYQRAASKLKFVEPTSLAKKLAKEKLTKEIADVLLLIFEVINTTGINMKDVLKRMNEELEKQEGRMKKK
jgi:NTP pyrophosphatase (non-canonical NTP hydrolase)